MNLHAHQFVMIRILPMRRPREESYADHAGSASIVILFVIPGFLGQWVIDRFIVRPGKTDLQTILTSIAASCAIWAFWYPVMLLVRHLLSNVAVQVVLLFLALFVTPVVGALVMSAPDLRVRTWVNERLYTWLHLRPLNPRPTAWDCAFARGGKYWVRVRLEDGSLVHGIYEKGSWAGTSLDRHDLFLAVTFDGAGGKFGKRVPRTEGVYISHDSIDLVEFWDSSTLINRNEKGAVNGREEGRVGTANDAGAADSGDADPTTTDPTTTDPTTTDPTTDSAV
jgi:hypothetical protein